MGEQICVRQQVIFVLLVVTTLASRGETGSHGGSDDDGPGTKWQEHGSGGQGLQSDDDSNICRTDLMSKLLEYYDYVYGSYQEPELFLLQTLGTNSNNKKCVQVKDDSLETFASLAVFPCDTTDTSQILKTIKDDMSGPLIYFPTSSNWMYLTEDSSSLVEKTVIYQNARQYVQNQYWNFSYMSDKSKFQLVSISSGGCLTRDDGDITLTTCVNSTEKNPNKVNNQLWKKIPAQLPWGQLINRNGFQVRKNCLHANRVNANSDFANVDLQECISDDEEKVRFELGIDSPNSQTISFKTGKVLSVFDPMDRNVPLQQMTKFYKNNQLWIVTELMNGWLQIRNSRRLSDCASAGADGSYIEIKPCTTVTQASDLNSTPLQFWKFKPNP